MENFGRREFIITGIGVALSTTSLFANRHNIVELPQKPHQIYRKRGKLPGKRVLLIGGIHGNEIGAYKSADLLIDCDIERGELIIIPRSNFTSILAKQRGYNGDMNRKFDTLSKQDPDYPFVTFLKEAILEFKPDLVVSMHDGFGFANPHNSHWGQSIVIDEKSFKNFALYEEAIRYVEGANRYLKRHKLHLINTRTFSNTLHKEQRKALTGWCLRNDIKAICIESSRNLSLNDQIYTHLHILNQIFQHYQIAIKPTIGEITENISRWIPNADISISLAIDGKRLKLRRSASLHIPSSSRIRVEKIEGTRGSFVVADGFDLNLEKIHTSDPIQLTIKNDYQRRFAIQLIPS